ncbi:hypothetical protein [Candidatus Nitrosocosmicus franklandus]|uniref:Uncharacterized protein n=1 Tax=Candidatus Nitrosocosmicus franklandianus TaxID=1798806 RepID=A0A484I916_9ARCH|nr:hypothetical protein [Candidatus Nitrosocosmicus franklandus]VFJ13711.1 conserved protein of unknown function [Candidatus Nitrosocosmicus franklandus]
MVTSTSNTAAGSNPSSGKHIIPEDKTDEVKALIARYVLLKIEQKKIEAKLAEIAKYYDDESLRTIFEPIGESMMGVIGLESSHNRKNKGSTV